MTFEDIFLSRLPDKPYCSNDYKKGLLIRNKTKAIEFEHIQTNHPHIISCLIFDLDFQGAAIKWEQVNLPNPTWVSINPQTKHAHLVYMLNTPVLRGPNASEKAYSYMTKIYSAYAEKLNADPNYKGTITKNPYHKKWDNIIYGNLYDLSELSEYIDLTTQKTKRIVAIGRNCELFETLRLYAYELKRKSPTEFKIEDLTTQALIINKNFPIPLEYSEIKSTVKSIYNWTAKRFNPSKFNERQRKIRFIVAEKTKKEIQNIQTKSTKEIAQQLNISERTVYRYIEKSPKIKPWEQQGISKSTYYRRINKIKTESINAPIRNQHEYPGCDFTSSHQQFATTTCP